MNDKLFLHIIIACTASMAYSYGTKGLSSL